MTRLSCAAAALCAAPLLGAPAPAAASACFAPAPPPPVAAAEDGALRASAARISGDPGAEIVLEGAVSLSGSGVRVAAERARVDTRTLTVQTEGEASLHTAQLSLRAADFRASLDAGELSVSEAEFELTTGQHWLRGSAAQFARPDEQRLLLRDAQLSTCPPEAERWRLRASELRLDRERQRGEATDVRFELGEVPILYLPWLSWPLGDRRQSGFLYPRVGYTRGVGIEVQQPWYWHIAPQADATFTPRYLQRRGLQLRQQWRYLSEHTRWQLEHEYLDDRERGRQRSLVRLRQDGQFGAHWRSRAVYGEASDPDYFFDLSESDSVAISHLDRRLDLRFNDARNSALLRLQAHQTLDEDIDSGDRPYRRLPQLLWQSRPWDPSGPLSLRLDSEAVHLTRTDSLSAWRMDIRPRLQYERDAAWGAVAAAATLAHSRYWLAGESSGADSQRRRTVPILSLDLSTRLRRPTASGGLQTLQPRLFYLYVPYRAQRDLPLFDTAALDFSLEQLFGEHRFSGRDRIGDANQLSLGLRSRYLAADGRELWRAGLGGAYYASRRRVTLDERDRDTGRSDLVGELIISGLPNWQLRGIAQVGADRGEVERAGLDLRYRREQRLLNLGYRYQRERFGQAEVSVAWPFDNGLTLLALGSHSLRDKRPIEYLLGLNWESCCMSLRASARRVLRDGEYQQSLALELAFKGLGGIGNSVGSQFRRAILGYQ